MAQILVTRFSLVSPSGKLYWKRTSMSNQANPSRIQTEVLETGEHKNCVLTLSMTNQSKRRKSHQDIRWEPTLWYCASNLWSRGENQPRDLTWKLLTGRNHRCERKNASERRWEPTSRPLRWSYYHLAGSAGEDQPCTRATWMQVRTNLTSVVRWDPRRY